MNLPADIFFTDGCMRCPRGGTADCNVQTWKAPLAELRRILLACGLTEELKWGSACYTWQENNVVILAARNANATIGFFKGTLLTDSFGLLQKPGENSQSARVLAFQSGQEVRKMEDQLKTYIFEAIEVEKAGLKVDFKAKHELELVPELVQMMEEMPELKAAFEALTPGRQRGYHLFFSAPKQSKTRISRIEKSIPRILEGKGMQD